MMDAATLDRMWEQGLLCQVCQEQPWDKVCWVEWDGVERGSEMNLCADCRIEHPEEATVIWWDSPADTARIMRGER